MKPEPRPQIGTPFADALEKAEVLGETAERDVLTVVRGRLRIAIPRRERLHRAAERRARLVQDDLVPGVDQLERRRQPRQPRSDDRDSHRMNPAPTIRSLVSGERCGGPSKTSKPEASIRSSVAR